MFGVFLQHPHHAVGTLDLDLPNARLDIAEVFITLAFKALPYLFVLQRHCRIARIDPVEPACGKTVLGQGTLPRRHYLFGIILASGIIYLVEDKQNLGRIGPVDSVCDEVLQGIPHGTRLGMAGIEEHQHQVRQVDDTVGDHQG